MEPSPANINALASCPLNLDILTSLMSYMDEMQDVLKYAISCRSLHYASIRYILGFEVFIYGLKKLPPFCQFMFIDHPTRLHQLSQLRIFFDRVDDLNHHYSQHTAALSSLLEVFETSNNLQKLDIQNIELLVGFDHRFVTALAELPALKELRLYDAGETTCNVLSRIRGPLEKLELLFFQPKSALINPLPHCTSFSSTLQHLNLTHGKITNSDISFPQVRSLKLGDLCGVDIRPLLAAFPNLTNLVYASYLEDLLSEVPNLNYRDTNRMADSGKVWPLLTKVKGDIEVLWELGLTSRVVYLQVDLVYPTYRDTLRSLLFDALPKRLRISLVLEDADSSSLLPTTIPAQCASVLTHLDIHIQLANSQMPSAMPEFIEHLIELFGNLPALVFLKIAIARSGYPYQGHEASGASLQQYLQQSLTPEDIAKEAIKNLPNLSHIAVNLAEHSHVMWKVHPGMVGGGVSMKQVSPLLAKGLMRS